MKLCLYVLYALYICSNVSLYLCIRDDNKDIVLLIGIKNLSLDKNKAISDWIFILNKCNFLPIRNKKHKSIFKVCQSKP